MESEAYSIKSIINRFEILLKENNEIECLNNLLVQYEKNDTLVRVASNLGRWKQKYIDANPRLKLILKKELNDLTKYFSKRGVLDNYLLRTRKKEGIFLELLGVIFGVFMIISGIYDEINHNYFQMDNSSSLLDVKPGLSASFYGLILAGSCISIIYYKKNK